MFPWFLFNLLVDHKYDRVNSTYANKFSMPLPHGNVCILWASLFKICGSDALHFLTHHIIHTFNCARKTDSFIIFPSSLWSLFIPYYNKPFLQAFNTVPCCFVFFNENKTLQHVYFHPGYCLLEPVNKYFLWYITISQANLTLLCYSLGSAHGSHNSKSRAFSLENNITLRKGTNYISLLSVMVGLPVIFDLISLILPTSFYFLCIVN